MCSGSADPSAAEATFGSTSAMPKPIATSGATSSAYLAPTPIAKAAATVPGGEQEQARDDQRPAADAAAEGSGEGRDDERQDRPRERLDAGADGRVAVHLREVLDDDEEGSEHREVEREAGAVGSGEAGPAEERRAAASAQRSGAPAARTGPAGRLPRRRRRASPERSSRSRCRAWSPTRCRTALRWRARGPAGRAAPARRGSRPGGGAPGWRPCTPTGTLIQKIQCQSSDSTIRPPSSGPSATPRPAIDDHRPRAAVRRSGGKAAESSVSVSGMSSAAPSPWTARATTSCGEVVRERAGGRGGREHEQCRRPACAGGHSDRRARRRSG